MTIGVYIFTQPGCEHCREAMPRLASACNSAGVRFRRIDCLRDRKMAENAPSMGGGRRRVSQTPTVILVEIETMRVLRRWDGAPEHGEFESEIARQYAAEAMRPVS